MTGLWGFDCGHRGLVFWVWDVEVDRPYVFPCAAIAFALGLNDVTVWLGSLVDNGPMGYAHLLRGTGTALLDWSLALVAHWHHWVCESGPSASASSIAGSYRLVPC